jgi:aarF domain-containing kinase
MCTWLCKPEAALHEDHTKHEERVVPFAEDTDAADSNAVPPNALGSLSDIDPHHDDAKKSGSCRLLCSLVPRLCRVNLAPSSPRRSPCCSGSHNFEICSVDSDGVRRSTYCVCSATRILLEREVALEKLEFDDLTESAKQLRISKVNQHFAQDALSLIKELKGYYIKAAQTLTGAGQLPPEMEEAFAELLDQCPREDFEVVRKIVEHELQCKLDDVFQEFASTPVAAASIGQVHFAKLKDGAKVAVKVQYPEVERFFKTDIKMVSLAMRLGGMGEKVKKVFDTMQDQFAQEFDYTKEAAVMREVAENILPFYGDRIAIPLPLDSKHPTCRELRERGINKVATMCTRKVLTMERLDGVPVRQKTEELMELLAPRLGTTVEELKIQMKNKDITKIDTSNKAVQLALNMGKVSETQSLMLRLGVRLRNCSSCILGCFMSYCMCMKESKQPSCATKKYSVPLNGPKLAQLLYDVHGHEMFENGLFNSDPHAGNIFVMNDGKLGLIDYGACLRLSPEQRTNIAKLFVAIADEDDDAVPRWFWACGFKSKHNNPLLALLLAHVFFNRGPYAADMNRLAPKIGMPQDISVMELDQYIRQGKLDEIEEFPGHLVMLQRCAMVLSGIGMELGAGRLSSAGMLKPQALKWLKKQEEAVEKRLDVRSNRRLY